jgi:hypothetical protein
MEYFFIKMKYPISLAVRGTRYSEKNKRSGKIFLGALLGFDGKIFTKINGYPNNFWGWGGEDDSLMIRFLKSGIDKVYYPKKGSVIDIEEYNMKRIETLEKLKIANKEEIKFEKLYTDMELWKENGLNNLEYKILERVEIEKNIYIIKVDLMIKSDIKKNPKLYNNYGKNYEKAKKNLYSIVIEERKKLQIEYV